MSGASCGGRAGFVVRVGAAMLLSASAFAQTAPTPAGLWKTIDDDGKRETSLIRITESGGVFTGKLEKLLQPGANADATCEKCTDDRKDKPILGLTLIRGVKHSEADATRWDGGDILDPNNGKTYKVRLVPAENGKSLAVRGYIGAPLFGRTQTWVRAD